MNIIEQRIKQDNEVLKNIKRGIVKAAKKGDLHYYWEITGLSPSTVKYITSELESDGRMVKSKGMNCKVIRW